MGLCSYNSRKLTCVAGGGFPVQKNNIGSTQGLDANDMTCSTNRQNGMGEETKTIVALSKVVRKGTGAGVR